MKERLLVMNGQRIVQAEKEANWTNQKVDKAGSLKPGIYNLYTAQAAAKKQTHDGLVVHVNGNSVYQQIGKKLVAHARSDFDKVPDIGSAKSIGYDAKGRATVTEVAKLARRHSI